jgi:eukaryotic-like serine/threonine-protein kinase
MSLIVRGTDAGGHPCVFKRLRPEDASREDLAMRLRHEASVLTHLAGAPGVIRLLDVREAPFTLMLELADGGSLGDRLRDTLPPDEQRRIARELVAAVAECHARGVIHRDLKPSNLLFVDGSLRIADFGVAAWGTPRRAVPEGWEEDEVGTPPWSAPELRTNATGEVAPAVDLYGLGMVLTALLGSGASQAVVAARSEDPARRPSLEELARSLW